MSEENKKNQVSAETENVSNNNQDTHNQNYEKIISEINSLREQILNASFTQTAPLEKPEPTPLQKEEGFKLG